MSGKTVLRGLLAATFVLTGSLHFVYTRGFMSVMPSFLPYPRELVLISGVFEILGALGILMPPPLRRWAGWGLMALLLAVFPANIEIARRGVMFGHTFISPFWGWVRLPFQLLLIAWVYRVTQERKGRDAAAVEP